MRVMHVLLSYCSIVNGLSVLQYVCVCVCVCVCMCVCVCVCVCVFVPGGN